MINTIQLATDPLAWLVVPTKVLEWILKGVTLSHRWCSNLHPPHKQGFLPGISFIKTFDDRMVSHAIFIDFANAIYGLRRIPLLHKIECSGISGQLWTFTRRCLVGCSFTAKSRYFIVPFLSKPEPSATSISACPLIFLICTNDLRFGIPASIVMCVGEITIWDSESIAIRKVSHEVLIRPAEPADQWR